ncbi:MAG TPA: OmpA family protein, partial [Caldimonas sp.]
MTFLSNAKRVLVSATAGLFGVLVGCAAPPQATNLSDEQPFDQAVAQATDGLAAQTQKLPAFLA